MGGSTFWGTLKVNTSKKLLIFPIFHFFDLNNNTIFAIFSIIVLGGAGIVYITIGLDYLNLSGSTPEPIISITDVSISYNSSGCLFLFDLVNSGETDGFAVVQIKFGPAENLIEENRYFVKANTIEEKQYSTNSIPREYCSKEQNTIIITQIQRE